MTGFGAYAIGIANIAMDSTVLDTWYPEPELLSDVPNLPTGTIRLGAQDIPPNFLGLIGLDEDRMVEQVAVRTFIPDLSQPAVDAHDVFLRLHLLSHRLVEPHSINMTDAINLLSPVVWTNKGPCLPDNFEALRTSLRSRGLIHVYGIDRLPRMVDYVVPPGVEIIEAERVRLGAYLAPGTRVLREGYVSFNAGTLGAAQVEGRLYSGAVVGEGADVGISASLMPASRPCDEQRGSTAEQLRVGKNCSFGMSSALIGINVGDNVHVGNNVVLDPDTPVYFAAAGMGTSGEIRAAATLEGQSNWSIKLEAGHSSPVARPTS